MNQVWKIKKLSDIARIFNGNSINAKVKKDKYAKLDDGFPFIATKDVGLDGAIEYENGVKIPFSEAKKFKIAPKNSTLICAEGGSAGKKVGFTDRDVCFGNKLFAVVSKEDIYSKFVFYYFFTPLFKKYFSTEMAGIIGGVSMSKFKKIEIPLPSIDMQKRITAILDKAFSAIEKIIINTKMNFENADESFESCLQSAFIKKDASWKEDTLKSVLVSQPRNGWSPPSANHSDDGIPVLTLSSVTGFEFKPDKIKYSSVIADPNKHYWVCNGDFLITRSNTPELVGHVAIAEGISVPTIYPDLIMRMIPNSEKILTKFLYYQMRTATMRREIMSRAHGANPTMKKITKGDVQTLPILIPPLDEQKRIIDKLDKIDAENRKLKNIYLQKLKCLELLKESLLQNAFTYEYNHEKVAI